MKIKAVTPDYIQTKKDEFSNSADPGWQKRLEKLAGQGYSIQLFVKDAKRPNWDLYWIGDKLEDFWFGDQLYPER